MKPRSILILAVLAILAIVGCFCASLPAVAGPFARCQPCANTACSQPVAPTIVEPAAPTAAAERPCLVPWNCPNGKCPREQINVSVTAPVAEVPKPDTPIPPMVDATPAAPPFPWGLCLGIVIPVVLLASVLAFVFRMQASSTST